MNWQNMIAFFMFFIHEIRVAKWFVFKPKIPIWVKFEET
jgi:hypothetical protein